MSAVNLPWTLPSNPALKNQRPHHKGLLYGQTHKTQPFAAMATVHKMTVKAWSFFTNFLRDSWGPTSLWWQLTLPQLYSKIPYIIFLLAVVHHATSVSIIAAVTQNTGKTHKCQILFSQSGCMSVTLCGLSLSRVLQRLLKTSAICFL